MGWDVGVGSQGLQLEAQESLVGSFTLTPLSPTTSSVLRRRCLLRHRMDHLVGAIKKDARDVNPPLPRPAAEKKGPRKRCVFGWMISAVETKDG
ncbi:hypothetical protein OsI_32584 [Oryza sativa Indica Group]|uniref:Uncharacterized protein n=1 Tax=Oryza sativa subsp. indica TaxID=39946 RepID=A2Z4L0_ORYSI|nr:hypothetical protein OsI_32584 [Oryza sativa Indica Group]